MFRMYAAFSFRLSPDIEKSSAKEDIPAPRAGFSACYVPAIQGIVVFGGGSLWTVSTKHCYLE